MNVLLVCPRNESDFSRYRSAINVLNERLCPDNIIPRDPYVAEENGVLTAILDHNPVLATAGASVCAGQMFSPGDDWSRCGAPAPDGTYALFRAGKEQVELLTDMVASRTIWHILTPDVFIASTSQRAIVSLLGSFHFNDNAISWMLSGGNLGPGHGWDERLNHLPGDARLLLNRVDWTTSESVTPVEFQPEQRDEDVWKRQLETAIREAAGRFDFDASQWASALSGGKDSRVILMALAPENRPQCVTWGLSSAENETNRDAHVAASVADYLGLKHTYYATDLSSEPIDRLLTRFLVAGEGRVDNFNAYADGFALWKNIRQNNICGILRGDEGFGRDPVASKRMVHHSARCRMFDDYSGAFSAETLGLPPQELPDRLQKREGETLLMWRDRLYHSYQHPYVLAALTDLKTSYVEIASPLLSRTVLSLIRQMPDALRVDRTLYKSVVDNMSPPLPLTERGSNASTEDILRHPAFIDLMQDELRSECAQSCLPAPVLQEALAGLKNTESVQALEEPPATSWLFEIKQVIRSVLPRSVQARITAARTKSLNMNRFAFRATIISRMRRLLEDDARALSDVPPAA